MLERLRRDVRTRWFILNNNHIDRDTVSPRLHRKSIKWEPSKDSRSIEGAIYRFEQALEKEFATLKHSKSSNLTMVQKNSLNFIRNQKDLTILLSDKNLGPMVVNRDDYIKAMMEQHLSNRNTYEIITKEEAEEFLSEASSAFIDYVSLKENSINSNDMKI